MSKRMKIGLFEARCADCCTSFAKPELGDFAYGRFLFTGHRGTVHAHFETIEHPVWALLEAAVPALNDRTRQGRLIQDACAHFADTVEGQRLLNQHVCPKCYSHSLASWDGRKVGETEVPIACFDRLLSLPSTEQLQRAKEFYAAAHII